MRNIRSKNVLVIGIFLFILTIAGSSFATVEGFMPYEKMNINIIQDFTLQVLLDTIENDFRIVPKDGTFFFIPQFGTQLMVIPLDDLDAPEKILFMYYLPEMKKYFFVHALKNQAGKLEMKIWSTGNSEIVFSEDKVGLLQTQGANTFRISSTINQMAAVPQDISGSDAIACIGQILGISIDISSWTNLMASITCSSLSSNMYDLYMTGLHCFSMLSVGVANITSTLGCISGLAKMITCGYLDCQNPPPSGVTTLQNDVPVSNISGSTNSQQHYKITVPSGATSLEIKISGGSGDCDLYVKRGQQASTSTYDYRPYIGGNNETVTVSNPQSGDWYIMLHGYSAYSGVTLKAKYTTETPPPTGVTSLQNDVPVSNISGASGSQQHYKITVPSGATSLEIKISGGSGDCDLYVKRGQQASTSTYDYRPYIGGNNETVTVSNPQSGDWYIMLHGYSAYSGVTLKAKYN